MSAFSNIRRIRKPILHPSILTFQVQLQAFFLATRKLSADLVLVLINIVAVLRRGSNEFVQTSQLVVCILGVVCVGHTRGSFDQHRERRLIRRRGRKGRAYLSLIFCFLFCVRKRTKLARGCVARPTKNAFRAPSTLLTSL